MSRHPQVPPPRPPEPKTVGAVVPDALYTLAELKLRVGWRDAAFRAAVRAGLKIYRSGKRIYVLGTDLIEFVTRDKGGKR